MIEFIVFKIKVTSAQSEDEQEYYENLGIDHPEGDNNLKDGFVVKKKMDIDEIIYSDLDSPYTTVRFVGDEEPLVVNESPRDVLNKLGL